MATNGSARLRQTLPPMRHIVKGQEMIQQGTQQKIYSRGGAEARRLSSLRKWQSMPVTRFIMHVDRQALERKYLRVSASPRELFFEPIGSGTSL
jgi:hypothetical protein